MIRFENDCVGPCPQGCVHCGAESVVTFVCDDCECECDQNSNNPKDWLFEIEDGTHLCFDCMLEALDAHKVEVPDEPPYND